MNLGEFIRKLIRNYMPESTSQLRMEEVFDDYYKELTVIGQCDYDKAYSDIFRNYDKSKMPNCSYLIPLLNKYKVSNNMTCPIVQIINFKTIKNGVVKEYAFSTADDTYEELKRKWEKLGWHVITDKYGEEIPIRDYHYAKEG